MPIEYRASESVGPLGEVAYASGLGAFRQSQQERADRIRQFNQQMQLQQDQLASQHQLGLKQLEVTRANQQDYINMMKEVETERNAARLESMQTQWELNEKSADSDIQRRMNAARMQMTMTDQREISKLQNAKRWIKSNPGLTDKQKTIMLDRVNARIYGILPEDLPQKGESVEEVVKERVWKNPDGEIFILGPDGKIDYRAPAKTKDELPPIDQDFKNNVWRDDDGNVWTRDRAGTWKLAKDKDSGKTDTVGSIADYNTLYKDFVGTLPPTTKPSEARKLFEEHLKMLEGYTGKKSGGIDLSMIEDAFGIRRPPPQGIGSQFGGGYQSRFADTGGLDMGMVQGQSWGQEPIIQPPPPVMEPQGPPPPEPRESPRVPGLSPPQAKAWTKMSPQEQDQIERTFEGLNKAFRHAVQTNDHVQEMRVRKAMRAIIEDRLGG